jgi:hypothetical protein
MRRTKPPRSCGRIIRNAGVQVQPTAAGAIVMNTAPYAMAFEYGTGGQPGGKVFWPTVLRQRRGAIRRIIGTLETKYGAEVQTGAE